MARRLIDIKQIVDESANEFISYLQRVINPEVYRLIDLLNEEAEVIIFSGAIRNFFLKVDTVRDIDIVLKKKISIKNIFSRYVVKENSFGGYKIQVAGTNIDLWYLHETWALRQGSLPISIPLDEYVPHTAFFNFSAIIFSFQERKFVYHKAFLSFLRNKEINYVYRPNANNTLCVVNTIYYSDKYHLRVSNKLKRYVVQLHKSISRDYEGVQKKHFGKVLYSSETITRFIGEYVKALDEKRRQVLRKKNAGIVNQIGLPILTLMIENPEIKTKNS